MRYQAALRPEQDGLLIVVYPTGSVKHGEAPVRRPTCVLVLAAKMRDDMGVDFNWLSFQLYLLVG